jgi:hypothetical protein
MLAGAPAVLPGQRAADQDGDDARQQQEQQEQQQHSATAEAHDQESEHYQAAWRWWGSIGRPRWWAAPLVGRSDLAWRMLVRGLGVGFSPPGRQAAQQPRAPAVLPRRCLPACLPRRDTRQL